MDVATILDRMVSHAMSLGVFQRVNTHEATTPTGTGLQASLWVDMLQPVASSGLDSTSIRAVFNLRIYTQMQQDPLDALDPELVNALDLLMGAYTGDFTLGGAVRQVDLLGATGPGLEARAGYLNIDGTLHRVVTITVPLIVNDVWTQEE